MQDELIVFTHNDLDALGCMINIEFKFPDTLKKYFHTNYANIDQIVDQIEGYIKEHKNPWIMIPDVSFSTNKDALRRLYNLANCIHIDHHLYPDGFWDEFPNMKVVYEKGTCAAKLCNQYFKNTGKCDSLDKITDIIDVYDIWHTEDERFDIAQDLNNYFWTYDIGLLNERIVKKGFKLPDDYMQVVKDIKFTYTEAIKDFEARKLIYRQNGITIAFVNDWFNEIQIAEMRNGQDIVIGVNNNGIVKFRIRKLAPISVQQKSDIRLALTGNPDIGHMDAFTYKIDGNPKFDGIIAHVEELTKKLEGILKG